MISGLFDVYNLGTSALRVDGITICGKLVLQKIMPKLADGVMENHSIFVAFAPMENQKALLHVIENGGSLRLLDLLPV
jgi:hypothetical protein